MLGENRSERAMIILDMINEKAHPEGLKYEPAIAEIIPFLQGELSYFRERMRPVIFCNTPPCYQTNEAIQIIEFNGKIIHQLSPRAKEICIKKTRPNAFFKTELFEVLQTLKVRTLTIVGTLTSVITTAASALDHGFSVVVPETCVCVDNPEDHAAALRLLNKWVAL